MKKFFNFFITAMVMCAAVGMTSCSNDDDDVESIIKEQEPEVETVICYKASVTKDLLTYYDVKLVISNEQKSKEVTLSAENCEKTSLLGAVDLLEYTAKEIDGVRGVSSVKAAITPKDHIERMLAETKDVVCFGAKAFLMEIPYMPTTGEWGVNAFESELHCSANIYDPKGFLNLDNGRPNYEIFAEILVDGLVKEIK